MEVLCVHACREYNEAAVGWQRGCRDHTNLALISALT